MIDPVYSAAPNRYESGMKYRRAGKSGILLPEISLGLWHILVMWILWPIVRKRYIMHSIVALLTSTWLIIMVRLMVRRKKHSGRL